MEGDLQRAVGRSLKAHRHERGLSQESFAEVLRVHRTYMGGLERGEHNLTLKSLERIARRLELDPLALLEPEGGQSPTPTRLRLNPTRHLRAVETLPGAWPGIRIGTRAALPVRALRSATSGDLIQVRVPGAEVTPVDEGGNPPIAGAAPTTARASCEQTPPTHSLRHWREPRRRLHIPVYIFGSRILGRDKTRDMKTICRIAHSVNRGTRW